MADFKCVVVGGGMTGHAAAQGIRSVGASAPIPLLGEEPVGPYARPPLTKGLWTGQEEGSIWLPPVEGLQVRTGARVAAIDRAGRRVGLEDVAYRHLPFFHSDLFDLGYEAVGVLDPRLEIVAGWKEPFRRGVVYYVANGRVRGVLAWGVFGKMDAARSLIAELGPHDPASLRGRIPA